jgi:hypothetical protein
MAKLAAGTLERIAAVLEKGEERTAFLREAIEREIERREAAGRRKRKSASTGGDAHKGGHRALLISSRRY